MTKAALRKLYKQKRNEISPGEKSRLEDLMLIQFQSLHLKIPDMVLSYSPIENLNEYNPVLIEEYCFFKNPATTLLYPVTDKEKHDLKIFAVKEDTLFEQNEYEIPEPVNGKETAPEAAGLIIVPLLCFNEEGHRVGYGKGYYDNFIKRCRPAALKIGFSFFDADIIESPGDFDEKMNICITPDRIYEF